MGHDICQKPAGPPGKGHGRGTDEGSIHKGPSDFANVLDSAALSLRLQDYACEAEHVPTRGRSGFPNNFPHFAPPKKPGKEDSLAIPHTMGFCGFTVQNTCSVPKLEACCG